MDKIFKNASSGTESLDQGHYRKTVSLFPTGVVIVTSEDGEGGVHGMTANSFTSISLAPPTVMISLKEGKMHRLISQYGKYGISILREEQQAYSAHFAGRPDDMLDARFLSHGTVPILKDSLAWFGCRVCERVQVQDHTLFIAEVVACDRTDGAPLIFYESRYHRQTAETY